MQLTVEAASGQTLIWQVENRQTLLVLATALGLVSLPCVSCAQLILFRSTEAVKKKKNTAEKQNRDEKPSQS